MTERKRQPSAEALERLARFKAEINREADAFKNPETFMQELESALSDTREGGLAILDHDPEKKTFYVGFAHFKRLAIQETPKGYFCGLQEFSAQRNGPIESLEMDGFTSLRAFYMAEAKYLERKRPKFQIMLNLKIRKEFE